MTRKKLFLASSAELSEDRREFEVFVNRKNKDLVAAGVFLELIVWEDFLDAVSMTRLQDEYNKAIRECDVFVMLFFTKVGQYTEEEFETAFGQFKATGKPFIFTYFKDAEIDTGSANEDDLISLFAFKKRLKTLGHFYTRYKNIDQLKLHFNRQLDKLAASGFIEFGPDQGEATKTVGTTYQANLTGNGAIAQGPGATAVGAGGVSVGGRNTGTIVTGTSVYSGDRLSLNFQDIEVRAVLQLLADFTGLNLVASDTVRGNITLRLKNVPWDQALDIVLKSKGLSMRQTGNVVMVAPIQEIAAQEKLDLESWQQIEELAPLRSEFIQVNYAKAAELAALMKSQDNKLLSERGNITVDNRTNTLLVQDTSAKLEDMRRIVSKLDVAVAASSGATRFVPDKLKGR